MPERPAEPSDHEKLFRARAIAQSFRARGEAVYPGKLLVIQANSFSAHPVDDAAFDSSSQRILGIAVWGTCAEFGVGMVHVEGGAHEYAPLITGEPDRPLLGIALLDAWITRADALRKLKRGLVAAFGGIPLSQHQLLAATEEISTLVRETAIALLRVAPRDERPVLLALASVADTSAPGDDVLTRAIQELVASAPMWNEIGDRSSEKSPIARSGSQPSGDAPVDEATPMVALTPSQSRVLETMARFDASRLLSARMIVEEMDASARLSEETVRQCVAKLLAASLAERPEGERNGARLTRAGRRLAGKIAD